jgi:hypothetical protein
MLDIFGTPLVVKAQRNPVHHSDRSIGRSQQHCNCGVKARNNREKCPSRKQEGAATGKTEFLAVEAV